MRGQQNLKEALVQNLQDAGCNKKVIDEFLGLFSKNEKDKIFDLLSKHRITLLKSLHKNQKEIDNLDYLILDLKKNNYNNVEIGGK